MGDGNSVAVGCGISDAVGVNVGDDAAVSVGVKLNVTVGDGVAVTIIGWQGACGLDFPWGLLGLINSKSSRLSSVSMQPWMPSVELRW